MPTQRPNILWICTDQQRFDTLGCYGNEMVQTPNLDRLANSGVLFENGYCQNPVCTPSRTSFLTGRYPRTTRCRDNGQNVPADEVPVTTLLAREGYTCGLAGKLHMSACHPSLNLDGEPRIDDGYQVFHWSHHPNPNWPSNEYGIWLREQGIEYQTPRFAECPHVQVGMPTAYHQTTWCVQKAIDFMEEQSDKGPWLFSVNLFDPHHPFDPPAEYLERYRDRLDDIPLPNYVAGELEGKPPWQGQAHRRRGFNYDQMSERDHRWIRAAYWAMCDLVDDQVGRLFAALDRLGERENTLVIFMSDHGEMLGDHGIYLKGPFFYEPAVHVPLIFSWPGVIPDERRSSALVELVDVAPTILEACGLEVSPRMQGRSLWPLLQGREPLDQHRSDIYAEAYESFRPDDKRPHATMVRTERYKLTVEHKHNTGELYDLESDPNETTSQWANPDYLAVKAELLLRMVNRAALTVDPMPPKLAPW